MINLGKREAVVQNLKDAGCTWEFIEDFLLCFDKEQKEKQLALLEAHRKQLLNTVHKEEKKIYCLDYLVYRINKEHIR